MNSITRFVGQFTATKLFIIAEYELRRILGSRKFKIMLAIMLLPNIAFLLGSGGIIPVETGETVSLEEFWISTGDSILNYWTGLPGQILFILITSEMLAGEYENETFKLLITKPLKKSEIVLGKWLAFVVTVVLLVLPPITISAVLICVVYGGFWDGFITIMTYDLWVGVLAVVVGATIIGTITLMFSASSTKSLYAALSAFVVTLLYQTFIPQLTWLENTGQYTLSYQLGVILEELGYVISPAGRLFEGDLYITLPAFYTFTMLLLTATIIFTLSKEAK